LINTRGGVCISWVICYILRTFPDKLDPVASLLFDSKMTSSWSKWGRCSDLSYWI